MIDSRGMAHNEQVSIAKGIGITLMVIGHSGCPMYLSQVIYSFHMVLFYFLSGFFFRDAKVVNNGPGFMIRKFRGLYWPYIKWSIVFIILHNFFYRIGFNEMPLSYDEMWVNIKRAIRGMWQGEHFLGAYWFLMSLFWEIVVFSIIILIKNHYNSSKLTPIMVALLFVIGIVSMEMKIDIWLNRELMILPFFYLGYLAGNKQLTILSVKYDKGIAYILCLPLLLIIALFAKIAVGGNEYGPCYVYIITSFCGIYLVMTISKQLEGTRVGQLLDKLGGVTLDVMTFHFLTFKVLTLILLLVLSLPPSVLKEWPVPFELHDLWLLYSFVGIIVPYGMQALYKCSKEWCMSHI